MSPRKRFSFPWRSRERIRTDVDDELRFHLDMRVAELVALGASESDARREAHREFGDLEFTRRYCRDLDASGERADRRSEWLSELRLDVAHALRMLRRSPGFATVALLTIALGVGANTAIFSVVRGVLLRTLPYERPDRIVAIYENNVPDHYERSQLSAADYVDYRRDQRTLVDIGATGYSQLIYQGDGDPQLLHGMRLSANVFSILGTRPALGRTFAPDEDTPAKKNVLVIAHATWRGLFGGDSAIVGRSISVNGAPFTIIGVMPPGFTLGADEQYWIPFDLSNQLADVNRARKLHNFNGIARLRDGVSLERARADLLTIARRNESLYPEANKGHLVTIMPFHTALVGDVRPALLILSGAAACVLLIACANLANVVFSRTITRRREVAIRAALGAGRSRLVRQLLTESALLALTGGLIGTVVGWLGTRVLLSVAPDALPQVGTIGMDGIVLTFSLALSLLSALLFGLMPAWTESRLDFQHNLRDGARTTAGRRAERLRRGLVVVQTALAVMLLVGAGLLVRSLAHLQRVDLGIDGENVLLADLVINSRKYDTRAKSSLFFETLFERMRQAPGVRVVGATSSVPLDGSSTAGIHVEGEPMPNGPLPSISYLTTNDDYFKTFGIRLLRGRSLGPQEAPDLVPRGVVLNEEAVRRFFPSRDPLGARLQLGPDPGGPWYVVVGVVANNRQHGFAAGYAPIAYTSYRQEGQRYLTLAIKTAGDPMAVVPFLRAAVRELDRAQPLHEIQTFDEVAGHSLSRGKFSMLLLSVFAGVSLVLALVGVYGVLAYAVSSRTRELGVRMALGANARDVLGLVLRQGFLAATAGVVIGLLAALGAARALRGLLYGVTASDLTTYATVAVALIAASLAASYLPARRATRVDPVEALRSD